MTPGSYPKSPFNQVVKIHNYDRRTYCEELGREVWGYIEYESPLHPEIAAEYELIPPPGKVIAIKLIGTDSWGREVFEDISGKLWKYAEPGTMPRERHDELYHSSDNTLEGEPDALIPSDFDYKIQD